MLFSEQIPELIGYFEHVPESLHPDRWWQRTMRWYPHMAYHAEVAEGDDNQTIPQCPHIARIVLLQSRPTQNWVRFQRHHPFPPWWYNNTQPPPSRHPPGAPLTVDRSQMTAWDNVPHAQSDDLAWMRFNRRYLSFDGLDHDPLVVQ